MIPSVAEAVAVAAAYVAVTPPSSADVPLVMLAMAGTHAPPGGLGRVSIGLSTRAIYTHVMQTYWPTCKLSHVPMMVGFQASSWMVLTLLLATLS